MKKKHRSIKFLAFILVIAFVFSFSGTSASASTLELPPFTHLDTYKVTYHAENGSGDAQDVISVFNSFTAKSPSPFTPPLFHYFDGWSLTSGGRVAYEIGDVFSVNTKTRTLDLYAVWEARIIQKYLTVTYHANNGLGEPNVVDSPYYPMDLVTAYPAGTFTAPAGMDFAGWSLTAGGIVEYYPGEVFTMPRTNVDLYGSWTDKPVLNREDHIAYMQGYPNGTFGPARNMTRAEAVVMFSRLITEQMNIGVTYTSTYVDVLQYKWYANAIGYMQQNNVLPATLTHYRPDEPITRAEFADLAVSFENLTTGPPNFFSDVPSGHPYYDSINYAVARGWLAGYPDGTFRPDNKITRAEVITVVNRVLERYADTTYVTNNIASIKNYVDLVPTYWAYYDIMEASNGHNYTKVGMTETWTSLL